MKKTIHTHHRIDASPERVWAHISQTTGVDTWLPIVTSCELHGTGQGAQRVCGTEEGNLYETILKIDHEHRVFQYSVDQQPLLPLSQLVGTMKVSSENGHTLLEWIAEFEVEDELLMDTIRPAITGMYEAGAAGLEQLSTP